MCDDDDTLSGLFLYFSVSSLTLDQIYMRYFYLYLQSTHASVPYLAVRSAHAERSHQNFSNLFYCSQLCTRVIHFQSKLISFSLCRKNEFAMITCSSSHKTAPTDCHRHGTQCRSRIMLAAVFQCSLWCAFNFSSCRERALCIRTLTPNLFDTINWRQVASKCEKRSVDQCVCVCVSVLSIPYVSHHIVDACGTQGEWLPWIIIALCAQTRRACVCGLAACSFELIDTQIMVFVNPFWSVRSQCFDHFFAPEINSWQNAHRQRLAANSQTMTA